MRIKNEFQILEEIVLTVDKIGIEKTVEIIRKARDLAKDNDKYYEFAVDTITNSLVPFVSLMGSLRKYSKNTKEDEIWEILVTTSLTTTLVTLSKNIDESIKILDGVKRQICKVDRKINKI